MIYTFAPNWYKSQCVIFDGEYMYYASNYILYKYELERRKVVDQICLRRVLMQKGIKCKDIKIHTLMKIDKNRLVIGFNNEYMVIIEQSMKMLNVMKIQKIDNIDNMLYIE